MVEESSGKSGKLPVWEAGRRVEAARVLRGYTSRTKFTEALASAYEVTANSVKEVEQGTKHLGIDQSNAIAEFLNLPRGWFTEPLEEVIPWEGPKPGQLDRIETGMERLLERAEGDPTRELEDDDRREEQGDGDNE